MKNLCSLKYSLHCSRRPTRQAGLPQLLPRSTQIHGDAMSPRIEMRR